MSDLEEKVNSAVEPMAGAVTSYGETSIIMPITAAVKEAGTRVRTELAAIEAPPAATAEALRGFDSASVAVGVAGHQGFDSSQWELRNDGPGGRFGGDYYYNPTTGESISTRLFQARRLKEAAAAHNRVLAGASDSGNPLAQDYFNNQGVPSLPGLPPLPDLPSLPDLPIIDSGGIVSQPTIAALAMNSKPRPSYRCLGSNAWAWAAAGPSYTSRTCTASTTSPTRCRKPHCSAPGRDVRT